MTNLITNKIYFFRGKVKTIIQSNNDYYNAVYIDNVNLYSAFNECMGNGVLLRIEEIE